MTSPGAYFQLALQDMLKQANISIPKLANAVGMHKGTLNCWFKGAQPKQTALPALRRLECFFAMEPNNLVNLAFEKSCFKPTENAPVKTIAYRERLAAVSKDPYYLKKISDNLEREWHDLLVHKTEKLPLLKRYAKGSWVTTEYITEGKTQRNQHAFLKDRFVPTASLIWAAITSYLGWICRPSDAGGAGLSVDEAQTIAWLTHKPMIHRFLTWKIERADNKVHKGIHDFVSHIKAFTHPVHGYLTQMPCLNEHLPEKFRHISWKDACQEAFEWSTDMKRNLSADGIEHSRDPMEPIKHILELPEPLQAVGDMVARMRANRPSTGGIEEAICVRDELLIRLMASNPLRAKNMKLLTYRPDNTGNLYRRDDNSWNIRIDRRAFKNIKGAAGENDYDVGVNEKLWTAIEQYLKTYRPMFPGSDKTDCVFLSSSTEKSEGYVGPWGYLSRRIFYLTKRFLWGCPGIGSHGMRYIVGTAILKKNPEAWGLAAAALHDKEETVRAHYAHLRLRDKVAVVHETLGSSYERL